MIIWFSSLRVLRIIAESVYIVLSKLIFHITTHICGRDKMHNSEIDIVKFIFLSENGCISLKFIPADIPFSMPTMP